MRRAGREDDAALRCGGDCHRRRFVEIARPAVDPDRQRLPPGPGLKQAVEQPKGQVVDGVPHHTQDIGNTCGRHPEDRFDSGAIEPVAAHAASAGVRVGLEPLNRYETDLFNRQEDAAAFLDAHGLTHVRLLCDLFHMNIEEPSIEASIRAAGDRIFHFHVADSNRRHPGAGHLDFAAILDVLLETGYTGFISGEFLPLPDAETAARHSIAHLRGLSLRAVRAAAPGPSVAG